jgi:hypothetical protein
MNAFESLRNKGAMQKRGQDNQQGKNGGPHPPVAISQPTKMPRPQSHRARAHCQTHSSAFHLGHRDPDSLCTLRPLPPGPSGAHMNSAMGASRRRLVATAGRHSATPGQNRAVGLMSDPVPLGSAIGAIVARKDQRLRAAHAALNRSKSMSSTTVTPRATIAKL